MKERLLPWTCGLMEDFTVSCEASCKVYFRYLLCNSLKLLVNSPYGLTFRLQSRVLMCEYTCAMCSRGRQRIICRKQLFPMVWVQRIGLRSLGLAASALYLQRPSCWLSTHGFLKNKKIWFRTMFPKEFDSLWKLLHVYVI